MTSDIFEIEYLDCGEEVFFDIMCHIYKEVRNCIVVFSKDDPHLLDIYNEQDQRISIQYFEEPYDSSKNVVYIAYDKCFLPEMKNLLATCITCGGTELRESRPWVDSSCEDKYDCFPGAYDRMNTRCPNRLCLFCGQQWFDEYSLKITDSKSSKQHAVAHQSAEYNCQ